MQARGRPSVGSGGPEPRSRRSEHERYRPAPSLDEIEEATMKRWVVGSARVLGGLAGAALGATAIGALRWTRSTARWTRQLAAHEKPPGPGETAAVALEQLAGLSEPAERYFAFALTRGQPRVRRARLEQVGELAVRAGAWRPFTAVEHFTVRPPGFLWDAHVRMAPLIAARVRDSYLAGIGATEARLAGLIPPANLRGTPEIAAGALLRYFAEAVWFPTALLPTERLFWEPVDADTARITLTDEGITVTLDVHLGPRGDIVRATAMRHRMIDGAAVLTPWVCHYRDYARTAGMMIPTAGEVEWLLPDGPLPYWRGRIISVEYTFYE
jgi:hypothetical protein